MYKNSLPNFNGKDIIQQSEKFKEVASRETTQKNCLKSAAGRSDMLPGAERVCREYDRDHEQH
jgi:hypothetical protein